jgi:hypothetical protein
MLVAGCLRSTAYVHCTTQVAVPDQQRSGFLPAVCEIRIRNPGLFRVPYFSGIRVCACYLDRVYVILEAEFRIRVITFSII